MEYFGQLPDTQKNLEAETLGIYFYHERDYLKGVQDCIPLRVARPPPDPLYGYASFIHSRVAWNAFT